MILLDTNVVSEVFRPQPDAVAIAWLDAQEMNTLYLCAPVLAEMRFGAELLDAGKRKNRLRTAIDRLEHDLYRDRILVFDEASALQYGRMAADRQRKGKKLQPMDGFIAAIAITHGASLATRNGRDFTNLGLNLINPFATGAGH